MSNKKSNKKKGIVIGIIAIIIIVLLLLLRSCSKKQEVIDNTSNNESNVQEVVQEPVEEPIEQEEIIVIEEEPVEVIKDKNSYSYWVNFVNKDGSVLQRTTYKYGEKPSYNGITPTYSDGSYYYSFKGWDKSLSAVYGTQIYTALYDITGSVAKDTVTPSYLTFTCVGLDNSDQQSPNKPATVLLDVAYGTPDSIDLQYRASSTAVKINGSSASTDWSNYTLNDVIALPTVDDYVQFKGNNASFSTSQTDYYNFAMSGSISASGDVTSLLNGIGGDTTLSEYCFAGLFVNCNSLTTAPSLPAKTLANNCYNTMFGYCRSLTSAPTLSATNLAIGCYTRMFYGCESLESAPSLPATNLADSCYSGMFEDCILITVAPTLSSTSLENKCYYQMFKGCTSLISAPTLPATALASDCYYEMFSGCVSLTSLPKSGSSDYYLPATNLVSNCYYKMFDGCTSLQVIDDVHDKANYGYIVSLPSNWINYAYSMFGFTNLEAKTYYWYTTPTCFVAGTKITMANGSYKNIEDVLAGDEIISYDTDKNEFYKTKVVDTVCKSNNTISTIKLSDGTIVKCTPNHPLYTEGGFKSVNPSFISETKEYMSTQLNIGDNVVTENGMFKVVSIDTVVSETVPVYNLKVTPTDNPDNKTYVANGIVVHNPVCG